jgi:hypothetical protein
MTRLWKQPRIRHTPAHTERYQCDSVRMHYAPQIRSPLIDSLMKRQLARRRMHAFAPPIFADTYDVFAAQALLPATSASPPPPPPKNYQNHLQLS